LTIYQVQCNSEEGKRFPPSSFYRLSSPYWVLSHPSPAHVSHECRHTCPWSTPCRLQPAVVNSILIWLSFRCPASCRSRAGYLNYTNSLRVDSSFRLFVPRRTNGSRTTRLPRSDFCTMRRVTESTSSPSPFLVKPMTLRDPLPNACVGQPARRYPAACGTLCARSPRHKSCAYRPASSLRLEYDLIDSSCGTGIVKTKIIRI